MPRTLSSKFRTPALETKKNETLVSNGNVSFNIKKTQQYIFRSFLPSKLTQRTPKPTKEETTSVNNGMFR